MMNRRQFLYGTSAFFAAAHTVGIPAWAAERRGPRAPTYDGPEDPRILRLDLETAAPLADLKRYYHDLLELEILEDEPNRLTVAAGRTPITFTPVGPDGGEPAYHFAFNIPENKIFRAREWQLRRSPVLKRRPDAFSHAEFEDVTDFWHWNAHSIFFEDPAGNLLEYIARHDLKNAGSGPFTSQDILYASEIGFIADDVPAFGEELQEGTGLDLYFGGSDRFRAFGDPNGLLLILKEGVQGWEGRSPWAVHPTGAMIRDGKGGHFRAAGHPYTVETQSP